MNQLTGVPANSKVYDVYAYDKPSQIGGVESHIGSLNMVGEFTSSNFGDKEFFIRHQDEAEDLAIHPEWTPYVRVFSLGGKCPYQMALQQLNLY